MDDNIKYVVGFLFSPGVDSVVLIKKNRPAWQAGRLNGVGGHVESGETHHDAMHREFMEEAGVDFRHWIPFFTISGIDWAVMFFKGFASEEEWARVDQRTDEIIRKVSLVDLPFEDVIPNLRWLIPMALDENIRDDQLAGVPLCIVKGGRG